MTHQTSVTDTTRLTYD